MYVVELLYYPPAEQGCHIGWAYALHRVNKLGDVVENQGPFHLIPHNDTAEFEDWWNYVDLSQESALVEVDPHAVIRLQARWGAPRRFSTSSP